MSKLTDKEWGEICYVVGASGPILCNDNEWKVGSVVYNKTLTWKKSFAEISLQTLLYGDIERISRGTSGCGLNDRTFYRAKASLLSRGLLVCHGGKYMLNVSLFIKLRLDLLETLGQHDSKYHRELRAIYDKVMKMKGFRMPKAADLMGKVPEKTQRRQAKKVKVTERTDGSRDAAIVAWLFFKELCDRHIPRYRSYPRLNWDIPDDVKALGRLKKLTEDPKWKEFLTNCVEHWRDIRHFLRAKNGVESVADFIRPEPLCKYKRDIEKYLAIEPGWDYSTKPTADKKFMEDRHHVESHSEDFAKYNDQ